MIYREDKPKGKNLKKGLDKPSTPKEIRERVLRLGKIVRRGMRYMKFSHVNVPNYLDQSGEAIIQWIHRVDMGGGLPRIKCKDKVFFKNLNYYGIIGAYTKKLIDKKADSASPILIPGHCRIHKIELLKEKLKPGHYYYAGPERGKVMYDPFDVKPFPVYRYFVTRADVNTHLTGAKLGFTTFAKVNNLDIIVRSMHLAHPNGNYYEEEKKRDYTKFFR